MTHSNHSIDLICKKVGIEDVGELGLMLDTQIQTLFDVAASAHDEINRLNKLLDDGAGILNQYVVELTALRERVKDYEDTQRTIMSERCDEVHCTCVPPLRAEVKRLTVELTKVNADLLTVCEGFLAMRIMNVRVTLPSDRGDEYNAIVDKIQPILDRILTQKEGKR